MKTLTNADLKRLFPALPNITEQELAPIGKAKFKGDNFPPGWSVNGQFDKGAFYSVYHYADGNFVVGKDGKGYKIVPNFWTKIYAI